ncbi:hypothetical protein L345_09473, partial [Ophiophagus hannah]
MPIVAKMWEGRLRWYHIVKKIRWQGQPCIWTPMASNPMADPRKGGWIASRRTQNTWASTKRYSELTQMEVALLTMDPAIGRECYEEGDIWKNLNILSSLDLEVCPHQSQIAQIVMEVMERHVQTSVNSSKAFKMLADRDSESLCGKRSFTPVRLIFYRMKEALESEVTMPSEKECGLNGLGTTSQGKLLQSSEATLRVITGPVWAQQ